MLNPDSDEVLNNEETHTLSALDAEPKSPMVPESEG